MAPGHMAHGALAGLVLAPLVPHPSGLLVSTALFVITTTIGALVPDLDHPKSRLTHALGPVTMVLSFCLVRLSKAVYMATRTKRDSPGTNGHRALTHTPVFALAVGTGLFLVLVPTAVHAYALLLALGLTVGCLAHLCGDSCTNSGVPWLWPLMGRGVNRGKRWAHHGIPKALRFETGGTVGEPLMTLASVAACVGVSLAYAYLGLGV